MKRFPALIIVFLVLGTAGLGWYAYSQQMEIDRLRGAGMSAAERDSWQKRVWDLEKRLAGMDKKPATVADGAPADATDAPDPTEGPGPGMGPGPGRGRRGDGSPFGMFMAMSNSPEFQKLMATQQRGMIDAKYAALFKGLGLPAADLEKFQNLLVDKQSSIFDVLAAARAQGLTGRENQAQVAQMIQSAQAEVNQSIQQLLGDQMYQKYQNYEATIPQQNTVDLLSKRLSYTQTPLTDQQSQQLVDILAASRSQTGGAVAGGSAQGNPAAVIRSAFGPGGASIAPITNQAVQLAQGVLASPQVAALQQMQQEQQAAQQMARLLRNPPQQSSAPAASKGGKP